MLDDIIYEARILIEKGGKCTVSSREIQTAVRLYFPGELAKHAVSEGTKAVMKYNANEGSTSQSNEEKSGLTFGIALVHKILKDKLRYTVSFGGSVYLASILEYICAELLELSGNCARDIKLARITPRQIGLAIRGDEELDKLFPGVVASAGVIPHIHRLLVSRFNTLGVEDGDGAGDGDGEGEGDGDGEREGDGDGNKPGLGFGGDAFGANPQTGSVFGGEAFGANPQTGSVFGGFNF